MLELKVIFQVPLGGSLCLRPGEGTLDSLKYRFIIHYQVYTEAVPYVYNTMCDVTQINSAYSTNIITALGLYLLNSPHREANSLFNEIPV